MKLSVGPKNGAKNNLSSISREGNVATHKVDICSFLKTLIEFCCGGVTHKPLWVPGLFCYKLMIVRRKFEEAISFLFVILLNRSINVGQIIKYGIIIKTFFFFFFK